jgi:hydrophobic/amphiphilic exporter-1 (mainly G- bacteria), HAE1 family
MVPLRALLTRADPGPAAAAALQQLSQRHHPGRPGARLQLGRRHRGDGADLGRDLAAGYGFEWTGTAFQEKEAGGKTPIVLGLAVLFAYLFLVALYESWSMPAAVLLSVTVGVLGALTALWIAGLPNDLYAQVGIVVLIGWRARTPSSSSSSPSSSGRRRLHRDAATKAARLRIRAVMMTSFAFILGWCRWSSPAVPARPVSAGSAPPSSAACSPPR